MFDADHFGGSTCGADGYDERQSPKRQYTLKGVESETIDLMRSAANREGMKIGSWVSMRLREAAERALRGEESGRPNPARTAASDDPEPLSKLTARVLELESELRELSRTQRIVMARLLEQPLV